ncbi:hypothetical protein RhiirA4_482388 [Rhizophagus irregularis]|uniref:Uncharacterized protein n=1 Tax=Rhizophagus irregularis TaxID=588596 RepID=A0A2I1HKZ5_9GLOM|nr:hypothetical protein RhiirA4_482388 [Rhizophagus irregularis]
MLNMGDSVGTQPEEDFLKFVSAEGESFLFYTTFQLGQFVENGFLKTLFDKNPKQPVDKAQLLIDMFGHSSLRPGRGISLQPAPILDLVTWVTQSRNVPPRTGYKEVDEKREQVRDIIVYNIPYTWDVEKVLGELTLWGKTIKLSLKWQHKYQTLRVKIGVIFTSGSMEGETCTGFGVVFGVDKKFPASWTLRERKQREKFQAVIHDIPEEMTMATLWNDCKPTTFLMTSGVSVFKIIQTSKGKRKLVGYFENWEATLKALETPQVCLENLSELKWCRHSLPNLKKTPTKPKAKNVPNKKPGKSGQHLVNVNLKKKDQKSSTKAKKPANSTKDSLKDPKPQKSTSNKQKRGKGGSKDNKEVLAEILTLLQNLV